jgi:hypothetical protein
MKHQLHSVVGHCAEITNRRFDVNDLQRYGTDWFATIDFRPVRRQTRMLLMRSLDQLAADLIGAADVDVALRIVNDDVGSDGKLSLELLAFDGRRNVLFNRSAAAPTGGVTGRAQVSMDHLPPSVRQGLLQGTAFVAVGDESQQYAKLLKLNAPPEECRLSLKGLVVDHELAGVLAAVDSHRRPSSRLLERLESVGILFSLVYAQLYEREARFEAVNALHGITDRMRQEHTVRVRELEQEILRLRTARGDVIDLKRVEQLQAAAENAKQRAFAAERRLEAIEHQVTQAVERLERAHIQLHEQNEIIRSQAETIRKFE